MARSLSRARTFAADWDIVRFTDNLDTVLSDNRVDAVYIATPHTSHLSIASAALRAQKHVLVEKPITMTAAHLRGLVAQSAYERVFLMEAMWMRFNPVLTDVLEALGRGDIGDIRALSATFGLPFPRVPGSRIWDASLGASTVLEQAVYPISLAQLVFGPPDAITARGRVEPDGIDSEVSVLLSYSDGRLATISTSMLAMHAMRANISGTSGHIEIGAPFWSSDCYTTTGVDFTVEHHKRIIQGNGYVPMLAAATDAIENGQLECAAYPLATSLAVMEVVDEIRSQLAQS